MKVLFLAIQRSPSDFTRISFLNNRRYTTFMSAKVIDCPVFFDIHMSFADWDIITTKRAFFYFNHGSFISLCYI
ncbi:MAG: hypothetical protein ACTSQL_05425 [Promethearchaeota archaeon]